MGECERPCVTTDECLHQRIDRSVFSRNYFLDFLTLRILHLLCSLKITDVQFSPDGYILASAAADGQVKLWDLRAGKPMHTFQVRAALGVACLR